MDWSSDYELEEATGVRTRRDLAVRHEYSDGDEVEAYLLDAVRTCSDVSSGSDELVARIRDWPSEYHFSASRATILAPFDWRGLTVLEVGSGCGALTRHLGESGAVVVALEGSASRARITAARCRDLESVAVVCDDFRDFIPPALFDVVLMIGVLEYAPCYFDRADPVGASLAKVRSCLKESGALVVAIENQLGLKYFAGCSEDHAGESFYGIEDRYAEAPGPVTFGRLELQRRLRDASFAEQRFFYPFPDYKLPRLLLADSVFGEPLIDAARLAGEITTRDYAGRHPHFFAEDAAWDVIGRNGLVPDFANSFLVAASATGSGVPPRAGGWLAESHTTQRRRAYRTVTRFVRGEKGIDVVKSRVAGGVTPPVDSPVELLVPPVSSLVAGVTLGSRLRRLMHSPSVDLASLIRLLAPWKQILDASMGQGPDAPRRLPNDLFDLVPWNLAESPSEADGAQPPELRPFDLEWTYRLDLDLDHVVFRGLYSILAERPTRLTFAGEMTVADLVLQLADNLGVTITRSRLSVLAEREAAVQAAVFAMDPQATLERMQNALERPADDPRADLHNAKDALRHLADLMSRLEQAEARVAGLEASLDESSRMLGQAYAQLEAVRASLSWRVTAPLRRLRHRDEADRD